MTIGVRVVNNLSMDIPAGKMTAIVGASGSGKTSVAQLLMRIYDVTEGEIVVDGNLKLKDLELRFVQIIGDTKKGGGVGVTK